MLIIILLSFTDDGNYQKKHKSDDENVDIKPQNKLEVKDDHERLTDHEQVHDQSGDLSETELNQCHSLSKSGSSSGMQLPLAKAKSPSLQQSQGSTNQTPCNYNSSLGSRNSLKNYSTSCMAGLTGVTGDQSYYPHHSPINRSNSSSFLPVSSSQGLLPQNSVVSSSLSTLHSLSPMNQMPQCRLTGNANTDCAMRQSSHLSSTSNYGLRTSPTLQNPSLPSCTYMQTSQGTGYPTHLTPNVHMMNMNFTGPLA